MTLEDAHVRAANVCSGRMYDHTTATSSINTEKQKCFRMRNSASRHKNVRFEGNYYFFMEVWDYIVLPIEIFLTSNFFRIKYSYNVFAKILDH